ncbi:MAG: SH3 domain-containing protein [Anaerolineae bacterium]|nr:SH3 domain-containing protein [Anaerolineae bacterium]
MGRHWNWIVTIIMLCSIGLLPVSAQGDQWSAWLFDSVAGQMISVTGAGGAVETVTLPLPEGGFQMRHVAVGWGGSPFVYVADSDTSLPRLIVAERDRIRYQTELPDTYSDNLEFIAGSTPFKEDNTALALGYSLLTQGWEIIIYDLRSGAITSTLRSSDPLVTVTGLESGFGVTPVIRHFAGNEVVFSLVLAGADGASQYPTYTWHLDTGRFDKNDAYPALDSDLFPATGEVIMTLPDDRLPNTSAAFPFFQSNTLQVYTPASGTRYPFFYVADLSLFRPRFIQNGEWILVGGDTAIGGQSIWLILGRDGQLAGTLPATITPESIWGLADGFLYTTGGFNPGATTLVYANTRSGLNAGAPAYVGDAGQALSIAWAGDTGLSAASAAAYTPWAQLAPPVSVGGAAPVVVPLIAPSLTPVPVAPNQAVVVTPAFGPALRVGGLATVQTTEGDRLNMRLSPGLESPVMARLDAGARVTIVDGPRTANGFTWWKIRAANGIEGWAVDSVDDNGVRLLTLLPY